MGELKAKEELGSDLEEEEEEPPTFLFCSARSVCALEDRGGGGRVQHGGKKKNRKRGELATYVRESVTRFTTVSFLLRLGREEVEERRRRTGGRAGDWSITTLLYGAVYCDRGKRGAMLF